MRAVVVRQFGEAKLLKVEEVPTPEPGDGEVLVEVKAAGINPSDLKNIQGTMHGTTLPRIPGRDFAGVVVKGPGDVVGREVWGTRGDIGFIRDGSHAQYILLPVAGLTEKPGNLSMDAAGSAGLIFVTAWSVIVGAVGVSSDDMVLIIGAGGGVGSATVQIAKARGAKVLGAVRSDAEAAVARENGVNEIINTGSQKLAEVAGAMTEGKGADVVFDTSGFMFAESIEAAAIGGRVGVISAPADGKSTFNLRSVYRKELRVCGVDTRRLDVAACAKLLGEMRVGFESGNFKIKPGQGRPLAGAAAAYEEAGRGKERVFLRMNE
jgi:NADPH:quinone reductase-like Zn-dependent oxidoreductase